jgi:hypothetical protein
MLKEKNSANNIFRIAQTISTVEEFIQSWGGTLLQKLDDDEEENREAWRYNLKIGDLVDYQAFGAKWYESVVVDKKNNKVLLYQLPNLSYSFFIILGF